MQRGASQSFGFCSDSLFGSPICRTLLAMASLRMRSLVFSLFLLSYLITPMSSSRVQLVVKSNYVKMDNGICQVTLSIPGGNVVGIRYAGMDNLLEVDRTTDSGGYWDLVWNQPGARGTQGNFQIHQGNKFKVIMQTDQQVELSFMKTWNPSLKGKVAPLNIDKRFVMLANSSGFYNYAIYERLKGMPGFELDQTRISYKLRKERFHYMAVADNKQRYMPLPDDRLPSRGQPLLYKEAVRLVNPVEPDFKGEVDDKYQYSENSEDVKVHGWISTGKPAIGFWLITPSHEFRSGGPLKQTLTSHVGPSTLSVFNSAHYAGEDLVINFADGEPWKKVFGPVFIHLNSVLDGRNPFQKLWKQAKTQALIEALQWPYNFPASLDFPKSNQRGLVSGRLIVRDSGRNIPARGAYVGLAPPGVAGSWQRESKGYQFWQRTNNNGLFSIPNVRPGSYNLYAWVPGFIGDYRYNGIVNIIPGSDVKIGDIVYEPPRAGPTLWEIGYPDRSAAEFYVPDPKPVDINPLFVNHSERYRQYGLWERYSDLYPNGDLVYTIGESNWSRDWFYAQVTRKKGATYLGTTWQIKFKLDTVIKTGTYKLRIALASADSSKLQVRVNDPAAIFPLFSSGLIGKDNVIARHGIHGLYWLFEINVAGTLLYPGTMNTIFLTQSFAVSPFQGILYDYIRFEGPSGQVQNKDLKLHRGKNLKHKKLHNVKPKTKRPYL